MFNYAKEILIHMMHYAHQGFCTFCPVVEPEGETPDKKVYLIIDFSSVFCIEMECCPAVN